MTRTRSITTSLALILALAPATALARGGHDDPAGSDDNGGRQVAPSTDDNPSAGEDNGGTRPKSTKRARRERRVAGECTGDSTSKLKVKLRDGRLKTEFEVDQNVVGVRWAVKLSRNGDVAVETTRTTRAPSGSFSIERRLRNGAGRDTIGAEATSPTGEVCTATITF